MVSTEIPRWESQSGNAEQAGRAHLEQRQGGAQLSWCEWASGCFLPWDLLPQGRARSHPRGPRTGQDQSIMGFKPRGCPVDPSAGGERSEKERLGHCRDQAGTSRAHSATGLGTVRVRE